MDKTLSDEPLTGADGANAFLGYERRELTPAAEEVKPFGPGIPGVEEAANAVTQARNAASDLPPIEKLSFINDEEGDKPKWQMASEAGRSLSDYHAKQRASEVVDDLTDLAAQVDHARAWAYGQPLPQQPTDAAAQTEQPPAEEAQPTEAPEAPADGLSPRVREALNDPEIRAFAEQQLGQLSAAERAYADGLAHNAAVTAAHLLADIPEMQGLSLEEASLQIQLIQKQNPARAYEIRQKLEAPRQMMQEAQRVEQQRQARAQHEAQARLHAFREEQDKKILKTRPELADRAVAKRFMDAAPPYLADRGFSWNELETLMTGKAGVAIFDARMQDILIDALKYREAVKGIAHPPAKPIPQVQKPGNGTSKGERSAAQVGDLRQQMKNSSGNKQLEAAVKYIQAKRAARG
jgi:hypothetical protein